MKPKQIRKFVGFLGEFHKRHKQLPPGWDNVMYDISGRPGDLMKFIKDIEIKYPETLKEIMRVQQAGDGGECEDEGEHPHHPGKHKPQRPEPFEGHRAGSETKPEIHFDFEQSYV
jgi:hypothetical protein